MKFLKYIISFIIIMCCFTLVGEFYQSYADNFSNMYETNFYPQEGISKDEMLSDIKRAADKNNVMICIINYTKENIFKTYIDIYGYDSVFKYIKSEYEISQGEFPSVFSGKTLVSYYDFYNIPDSILNASNTIYSVIGSENEVRNFKKDLINKYGGSFPSADDAGYRKEAGNRIIIVWLIASVIISFMTLSLNSMCKKETMIRVSLGESIGKIVFKNILLDSVVISVAFVLSVLILKHFTNVFFYFKITLLMCAVLIALNILSNLNLLRINVRLAFSKDVDKIAEPVNYLVKVVCSVLTAILLCSNLTVMYEAVKLKNQESFFLERKDYNYLSIVNNNDDDTTYIETQFYLLYNKKFDIQYIDKCVGYNPNNNAVLVFENTLPYLAERIPEIDVDELNKTGCAVIIPDDAMLSDDDIDYLCNEFEDDSENVSVIKYKDSPSVITIDQDYLNRSEWIKNPVILYVNTADMKPYKKDDVLKEGQNVIPTSLFFRFNNMLIKSEDNELSNFEKEYNVTITKENAYEYYLYRWQIMKRTLYLNTVIFIFVLMLDIGISYMIIKTEYKINAVEFAVKKANGYSMFERIKKLYYSSIISTAVCTIASVIIAKVFLLGTAKYLLIGNAIICIIEILIIALICRRYEKVSVPKILKGGL